MSFSKMDHQINMKKQQRMKKVSLFLSMFGYGSERAPGWFIENGSILLEKLIGSWNGRCSPIRSFSAKELREATNNYDSVNVVSDSGVYKWYKGSIEGRIVSIKKTEDRLDIGDFERIEAINDIVTAAQITSHNNVLKLIGHCLETRIPISVYEFAENGTLSSHIHICGETTPPPPILWEGRLRIVTEVASAVAYLHTAFRTPIIHRDISSSNVFLDPQNVSKLSGFELSIAIPEGETHVEDKLIIGTRGYISPEYLYTNLVTEKNNVYSFGVLVMELLSGRKPVIDDRSHIETYFRTHVLSNEYNKVLDPAILDEVGRIEVQQQVQAVSELALRCTENVDERPTMMEVAKQLLQLRKTMIDR